MSARACVLCTKNPAGLVIGPCPEACRLIARARARPDDIGRWAAYEQHIRGVRYVPRAPVAR